MSAEETDVSLRYWKAAISTLPPEKRDAAWEFYLNKFSNDRSGDTLSGLILLLEAHGVFMQTLPLEFEAALIQPMRQALSEIKLELQQFAAEQREVRSAVKEGTETIAQYSNHIALFGSEVQMKVQMAVQDISTKAVGASISHSLQTSTLQPLRDAVKILSQGSSELENCSKAAKHSVELWRKVHVGGMFLWALASAIVVSVIICGISLWKIRGHYEKRITEFTNGAGKTAVATQKLQQLGIALDVKPALDSNGVELPGTFAIHIPKAGDFNVLIDGNSRTAIVHVKPGVEKASRKPATIK